MDRLLESKSKLRSKLSKLGVKSKLSSTSELVPVHKVNTHGDDHFPSGIKVLYEAQDPMVDIVFVHGLTGDRERTWTYPETGICWPRDILPQDLPDTRIMTFGYDGYVVRARGQVSRVDIAHHATDFLNCLANERMDSRSVERPIILVAHSLGGLLCKDAIRLSENATEARFQAIAAHLRGILFIATPHGGSWLAKWAKISAGVVGMVKTADVSLLSLLETDSEVLSRIHNDFLSILMKRQADHHPILVSCFYEVLPLVGRIQIVDPESATIPGFNNVSIHADHRNIARFKSGNDPGYKHAVGILSPWTNDASGISANKDVDDFLESLASSEMGVRKAAIEPAEGGTCQWLADHPYYKAWSCHRRLEESHGLLWIKGKPGSGKSTMMKHAFLNLQTTSTACRIGFFFNARGGVEEKSSLGLFRTLLHQLVSDFAFIRVRLMRYYKTKKQQSGKLKVVWNVAELREMLYDAITHSGKIPIEIFVDALDECNEDEVRSVVKFFGRCSSDSIKNYSVLRICWSSRHYRHITIEHSFQIWVENMNSADISLWVKRHLSSVGRPLPLTQFESQIVEKSKGVFLWSVLIVNKICKLADKGLPMAKIEKVITEVPSELDELYKGVVSGIDPELVEDAVALIYWMLFAYEPLDTGALQVVLGFQKPGSPCSLERFKYIDDETPSFRLLVTELSGGLLEVVDVETSTHPVDHDSRHSQTGRKTRSIVQPIHESVCDFFLKGGFAHLPGFKPPSDITQIGHLRAYEACAKILSTEEMRCVLLRPKRFFADVPKLVDEGRYWLQTSLLLYIMKYIFLHLRSGYPTLFSPNTIESNEEPREMIQRDAIVDTMKSWMSVNTVTYVSRRYLDNLAETLSMYWEMTELDFCALDDHRGLCALLERGEVPIDSELDKVIIALAHHGLDDKIAGFMARFQELYQTHPFQRFSGVALESAIKGHHPSTVKLLLGNGEVFRPFHLILAIQQGQEEIVQMFLDRGANINQSAMGKTPIIEGIGTGRLGLIQLLLEHKPDINRDHRGKIAICEAIAQGRRDIVEKLLDHGAAANYSGIGKIPINEAVALGFKDIVEILLEHGASIDVCDEDGETALVKAEKSGRQDILELVKDAAKQKDRNS